MEALATWLAELPPDPERAGVVHGDFKLDNVMLDPADVGALVAVLDWEMSALGDPLVDLGILLAYWTQTAPPGQRDALTSVTTGLDGSPGTKSSSVRGAKRPRSSRGIRFYETFALFKIAVVIQQIFFRYTHGRRRSSICVLRSAGDLAGPRAGSPNDNRADVGRGFQARCGGSEDPPLQLQGAFRKRANQQTNKRTNGRRRAQPP